MITLLSSASVTRKTCKRHLVTVLSQFITKLKIPLMKPNAFVASYKGPFPTSNHIDELDILYLEITVEKASNWKVSIWKV